MSGGFKDYNASSSSPYNRSSKSKLLIRKEIDEVDELDAVSVIRLEALSSVLRDLNNLIDITICKFFINTTLHPELVRKF